MAEFIIEQDDSFTVVTNTILRDKSLSMSAKGLLCTKLSLPPEWDYSFNRLVAICKEGKSAVRNTINELKDAKYIKISQSRSDKGYYISIEVKGNTGQHWVAVLNVDNTITIADPASDGTSLWSTYNWENTSQFVYFKIK